MSISKYESSVKSVNSPVEAVYKTLSDLNNIERIKDRIPADKVILSAKDACHPQLKDFDSPFDINMELY